MVGVSCGHAACSDREQMQRRTGPIFTAMAAGGLLFGLVLSLVACPRPIDNPANPNPPVNAEPDKGNTVEPGNPAPGDAGPPPPVNPPASEPTSPEGSSEHPAVDPTPPPIDPKNAPLRV
jgi:hypothetical protein